MFTAKEMKLLRGAANEGDISIIDQLNARHSNLSQRELKEFKEKLL